MARKIISLDIRNDKILALLIKTGLKGHIIEAASSAPVPADSETTEETGNKFISAVDNAIRGMDLSGAEIVVSIPPNWISYRNLRMPFKDRKKIRQVLPFEIESTLPFPVEDVVMDFQTVRLAEKTDIFVCAVKTSDLMSIVDVLKSKEEDPQAVTSGGFPTAMCLAKFANIAPQFLFMDVERSFCTVFAISSGQVYLARTFQSDASDSADKGASITRHLMQFLAAFEAFYEFGFEPATLCISGDEIHVDVLKKKLDPFMNVPVQSVDILSDVMKNTTLANGVVCRPEEFNGAMSMAALEIPGVDMINFYGERTVIKRYWEENKNDIIKTAGIALFVFIIFMFNVLLEARQLNNSIRNINQQILMIFQSTFPDVNKIVDPVQQMRAKIQEIREKSSYAGDVEDITLNIDILNEISRLVPDSIDVEFTQFVRGDENILISGDTNTFNAVDEIKVNLEKSDILKNIVINSANLDASSNRVQFKLKVDL